MAAIALPNQPETQTSENMLAEDGRRLYVGTVSLPNSYNTNGYLLSPGQFGMTSVVGLLSGVIASGGHCLTLNPVISGGVITAFTVFDLTTGAEAISTLDCSALPITAIIVGV